MKKAKAGRVGLGVGLPCSKGSCKVLSGVAVNLAFITKSRGWSCKAVGKRCPKHRDHQDNDPKAETNLESRME